MSDKKIKIYYIGAKNIEAVIRTMQIEDLPIVKDFVLDSENPDYLIATPGIYTHIETARTFRKYAYDKNIPIRILFSEEAIGPDFMLFDYAVTWNWNLSYMDRTSRLPPYVSRAEEVNNLSFSEAKALLKRGKKRFCNFIYSNGIAHPNRDKLFHAISAYKKVDSLGRHMNNVNTLIDAKEESDKLGLWPSWYYEGIRIKSKYKFSIASENAIFDGYTSEKLLTSLLAHTVPIYWGNPHVVDEYNPEAFINCNDYKNFEEVVKRVREIDEDDDLWAHIVSQPIHTEAQKKNTKKKREDYLKFITKIFTQPLNEAKRRPEGFWPGFYDTFSYGGFFAETYRNILEPYKIPAKILTRMSRKFLRLPVTRIEDFFRE